tara:strand:- start:1845 stop:2156 length:312 start_codon:yes stop_codon:yes gene_type:complete
MSGVKNWLMEMQEYSHYLIESMTVETAREFFIKKYGESQVNVFNDELAFLISEGIELFEGGNTYDKDFFDREDERQLNLSTKQQEDLEANIKGLKKIMGADYE